METLISLRKFVLEHKNPIGFKSEIERLTYYNNVYHNYARFLSQPLEIWQFVPCKLEDGVWVVLTEPEPNYSQHNFDDCPEPSYDEEECKVFREAKERCLFKGFEVYNGNVYFGNPKNGDIFYSSYKDKYIPIYTGTVESMVDRNFTLTQTAKNQILK